MAHLSSLLSSLVKNIRIKEKSPISLFSKIAEMCFRTFNSFIRITSVLIPKNHFLCIFLGQSALAEHFFFFVKIYPSIMSFAQILREIHRKKQSDVMKYMTRVTLVEARQNEVVFRKDKPSFLERARKLGYKAKNGYSVWGVRIRKGDAIRNYSNGNTRGKCVNAGIHQIKPKLNKQAEAEQIIGKQLGGLRVLNSYKVGQDLRYHHFEVIMVDASLESIRNDHKINWICNSVHKHREMRGLTSAGRKSRGLGKGIKHNNTKGGSVSAAWRNRNSVSLKRYR